MCLYPTSPAGCMPSFTEAERSKRCMLQGLPSNHTEQIPTYTWMYGYNSLYDYYIYALQLKSLCESTRMNIPNGRHNISHNLWIMDGRRSETRGIKHGLRGSLAWRFGYCSRIFVQYSLFRSSIFCR